MERPKRAQKRKRDTAKADLKPPLVVPQIVAADLPSRSCGLDMWKGTITVLIWFCMAACSSIGPGTVPRDRVDDVNAIGTSWERETLLNIVKLRYGHAPIFFSVTQVVTGYQFQGTVTGGLVASNFTPVSNILGLAGTATAEGQYTDRPTVIYTPLTGVDFLQKLMTPIPPSARIRQRPDPSARIVEGDVSVGRWDASARRRLRDLGIELGAMCVGGGMGAGGAVRNCLKAE